jgi:serine/threonine-protein kinase RsbT
MEWVGVGNVGGLMVRCGGSSTSREAVAAPGGVVGYQLPPLRTVRLPLSWGDTVVLTSDGIRGDFERDLVEMDDVQSTAEQVLARHGRVNDDACVLVVRYLGLVNQRVAVRHDSDIVVVRRAVRRISREQGLPEPDAEALATAVTEIAQNILVHAEMGELFLGPVREASRRGVMAVARDRGPGIADPARALVDGFTTGAGLGLGLPSAKRLVDDFSLISDPLAGTVVTLRKWRR